MPGILKRLLPNNSSSQRCPDCDASLTSDTMNIREGVALCPSCGKLSRLSELSTSSRSMEEILAQPPSGCSINSHDQSAVATVSLRSLDGFPLLAGFALFWNGITSIFVLLAIAGLYTNLIGPLPHWFPAPGLKEGKPEINGGPMELGTTLFLCVFLLPFVTVGVVTAGAAIMNLFGKVEVVTDEFDSFVATGIGFLRWKRRFDPREVRTVEFGTSASQSEGGSRKRLIEIKANETVEFGSTLQADQMEWLRAVLRKLLLPQKDGLGTSGGCTPITRRPTTPLLPQKDDRGTSRLPSLTWISRRPL